MQNYFTDTIAEKYQDFSELNKKTAKDMIRKKAKQKRMKYSDNERVTETKSNLYTVCSYYTTNPTDERQKGFNQKKTALKMYLLENICRELKMKKMKYPEEKQLKKQS